MVGETDTRGTDRVNATGGCRNDQIPGKWHRRLVLIGCMRLRRNKAQ